MDAEVRRRLEYLVRFWRVSVTATQETRTSLLAFGTRGRDAVVLKLVKHEGDEWRSGEILAAFAGRGAVRVYEHVGGAMLLERANPGTPLVNMVTRGRDEDATAILGDVIDAMSGSLPTAVCPSVGDWSRAFEHYIAGDAGQLPRDLVAAAQAVYERLVSSQRHTRLLHGDLQHYNIVEDRKRGWLAIDPKGVVGDVEYEIGALLRNPTGRPDLFISTRTIERRIDLLARRLTLNADRVLAWAFSQAVLSAIWNIEDGYAIDERNSAVTLAMHMRRMIPS